MAYGALVERTVPVSRARLYSLLVDEFGAIGKLMGDAVESCTLEGDGIGAVRHVRARGVPGVLSERLDTAYDGRVFSYSLVAESSLPLEHYVAVVTLADAPNGGCAIAWGSNWLPKGAPADQVRAMLTGLYNGIIDALVRAAT
ncbi:MAG: SRPBCC family protein [Myxococcota bacterium]